MPFVRSMSFRFRLVSSMGLSPVSFDIAIAVASLRDVKAIRESILFSCGIFGILDVCLYFGFSHVKP